ncbi:hypothetical protein Tco_1512565, partial [Tanacetum coccineum]
RVIKLSLDPSFLPQGRAPVGGVTIRDPVSKTIPILPEIVGKAPHDSTTGPSSQPKDDTSEKVVHESSSTTDSERTESGTEAAAPKGDKEQDEAGSDPEKAHEALAGPDPEPMQEDQTGSDSGKVHVSLAGPNPEHMDEEFLSTAYPKFTPPPINTEATTITKSLPEITPFIALQLKVAKLEQDMSEVKKTAHSAAVLALIKS